MLDEELRRLTASEPLSLEEEYEMQQNWLLDEDKLTFIILSNPDVLDPSNEETIAPSDPRIRLLPMVGDVNIFLHGTLASGRAGDSTEKSEGNEIEDDDFEAEVEIMIAEPAYRRRGLAQEALQLMLSYATGTPRLFRVDTDCRSTPSPLHIPAAYLVTRITESNEPSIRLFEKLGFKITKRVPVFEEVEMRWRADT
ncbi:N-acetyltransferase 9-like protein [Amanita rubescens]|nr:N-acetyltransferase 9-like protein [Amanita rubescens]